MIMVKDPRVIDAIRRMDPGTEESCQCCRDRYAVGEDEGETYYECSVDSAFDCQTLIEAAQDGLADAAYDLARDRELGF